MSTPTVVGSGRPRAAERAAIFAVFFELGIFAGTWAAALPGIKAGLDLSDRAVSLALLAFAVASIAATVLMPRLARRIGTRRATQLGVVATAAALPLPAFAPGLAALAAAAAAMGFAMGVLDVAMNAGAAALEERRGRPMMSAFHGAFSLGGLAGAALGGLTAPLGPLGQLGLGTGAALLVAGPLLPRLGPDPAAAADEGSSAVDCARLGSGLLGLGVVAAFCFTVEGATGDWSAIYLHTVAGSGLGLASAGYAGFSIAMAGVRFAGDRAVTALGARRVLVGGGIVAGAGLALAVAVPAPIVAALGFALVGLGLGNVAPVAFGAAARRGASPAAGVAAVARVGYAGLLLGPPIIGALSAAAGLRAALACLIVATAVVALVGFQSVAGRRSRT